MKNLELILLAMFIVPGCGGGGGTNTCGAPNVSGDYQLSAISPQQQCLSTNLFSPNIQIDQNCTSIGIGDPNQINGTIDQSGNFTLSLTPFFSAFSATCQGTFQNNSTASATCQVLDADDGTHVTCSVTYQK